MTEFFGVAAEPRNPLMMKILVRQEAFILGVLTGFFSSPMVPTRHCSCVCWCFTDECCRRDVSLVAAGWQGPRVKGSGREGKCLKM